MYRDFLSAGREGLHHVAFWPTSFEPELASLLKRGYTIGQQGRVGHPGRFVYLQTESHPGTVVELSDTSGPKGRMFGRIADAASKWDGKEAIRTNWPMD